MGILICDPFNSLQVPILEGEESDGDVPRLGRGRLGSRASAARRDRRTRNNSLRLIRYSQMYKTQEFVPGSRYECQNGSQNPPDQMGGGDGWSALLHSTVSPYLMVIKYIQISSIHLSFFCTILNSIS